MTDDTSRQRIVCRTPELYFDLVVKIGQVLQSSFSTTLVRYLNHKDELRSLISLQHALSCWCLVSRLWYSALNPVLYKQVLIYQYKQASQLIQVLQARLGHHTNTVVLDCTNSINIWRYIGGLLPLKHLSNIFLLHLNLLLVHPSFSVVIRTLHRLSYKRRIYILEVVYASELQLHKIMLVLPRSRNPLQETSPIMIRPQTKSPYSTPLLEALRCDMLIDRRWAILDHHGTAFKNEACRQLTDTPRARISSSHSLGDAAAANCSMDVSFVAQHMLCMAIT